MALTALQVGGILLGAAGLAGLGYTEVAQARSRKQARTLRPTKPKPGSECVSWGPIHSEDGQEVGRWVPGGPAEPTCVPECDQGYEPALDEQGQTYCRQSVGPLPPPPGPEPGPPTGDYVGSGWVGWPRKEIYPDEASFSKALSSLGYADDPTLCVGPGGSFAAENCAVLVEAFQEDFNIVRAYAAVLEYIWLAPEELPVDGAIRSETVHGLEAAADLEQDTGTPWQQIVTAARQHFYG